MSLRSARTGLFLAELLLAMSLFITAFVVLLGVMTTGSEAIAQARNRITAQCVAQKLVETLRANSFPNLQANLTPYTGSTTVAYQSHGSQILLDYTYTVTITDFDVNATTPPVGPTVWKNVNVEVDWTYANTTRGVHLQTAVGQ